MNKNVEKGICAIKLREFKTKYPSSTSADLQTFIIGFSEAEEYYAHVIADLKNQINVLKNNQK